MAEKKLKVDVSKLDVVWPAVSALVGWAPRHPTIGNCETVLTVHTFEDDTPGTLVLERYQPEDKKSMCEVRGDVGLPRIHMRLIMLAAETLRGYDSVTARVAAAAFKGTYNANVDIFKPLFDKPGNVVLHFPNSKSTQNMGTTFQKDAWLYVTTFSELRQSALDMVERIKVHDALTVQQPVEKRAAKAKEEKIIEYSLNW